MTTHAVDPTGNREEANKAILIPDVMRIDDGRELEILKWEPCAVIDDIIRVKIEAIVRMPTKDQQ